MDLVRIVPACLLALVSLAGCFDSTGPPAAPSVMGDLKALAHQSDCPPGLTHTFDVYVKEGHAWESHDGQRLVGLAFGLSPDGPFTVPGPEIRVRQCDTVRVDLHVEPDQLSHTIHWHGLSLPWAMDGVPYVTQDVGPGTFRYEFQATEAGTYWYHCHVEAPVHQEVGMFGALIVEPLHPSDIPYDREAVLMLSDMDSAYNDLFQLLFAQDPESAPGTQGNPYDRVEDAVRSGRMVIDVAGFIAQGATGADGPSAGPRPYYPEESLRYRPQYDTFLINGKAYPDTAPVYTATGETLRLRLVNAGSLVHTIHLHGHHFLVTHADGYPLAQPYYRDTIVVGSGQRYDVYVHSDNPGVWDLHDHGGGWGYGGHAANDFAFPGGMSTMLVYEDFQHADLPVPHGPATSGHYALFAR